MATNQATTNETDECEIAYSNPKCPYVTQININTQAMTREVTKAAHRMLVES